MTISHHAARAFLQRSVFRGENNIYLPRGLLTRINVFKYFQKRQVHFSFKTSKNFLRRFYYYSFTRARVHIFIYIVVLFPLCESSKGLSRRMSFIKFFSGGVRFFDIFFRLYVLFVLFFLY